MNNRGLGIFEIPSKIPKLSKAVTHERLDFNVTQAHLEALTNVHHLDFL